VSPIDKYVLRISKNTCLFKKMLSGIIHLADQLKWKKENTTLLAHSYLLKSSEKTDFQILKWPPNKGAGHDKTVAGVSSCVFL
jgi:hypothetical protein